MNKQVNAKAANIAEMIQTTSTITSQCTSLLAELEESIEEIYLEIRESMLI